MEARKAMLAARAARLLQLVPSAPETGVKPDATGGGPGPVSYTYSVLYTFTGGAEGGYSDSGVVLGPNGNLYGTTAVGGDLSLNGGVGAGVVFKLDPFGKLTVLHTFTGGADGGIGGDSLNSTPILDNAGNLYGATNSGGAFGNGVVLKIDPKGNETVLSNFAGGTAGTPGYYSPFLLRDNAGNLFSALASGGELGEPSFPNGCGVIFKINAGAGKETPLYTFPVAEFAPCLPDTVGPLVQDEQGNLYGVTAYGGSATAAGGSVYKLDPAGKRTVLHSFPSERYFGETGPQGGLIRDDQGNLYGVAGESPDPGEVFKLDPSGNLTVLYAFTGGADGGYPDGPLVRDAQDNLYGTTRGGGDGAFGGYGCGVVFKLDPSGNETVLHTFNNDAGGCGPTSGAVMDEKGNLYGVTDYGGDLACLSSPGLGCGTVFKLTRSPQLPW
jgi:uncharacterized repeat protein (TIGR03803 family)